MKTNKKSRVRITDEIETEMEKWRFEVVVGGEVVVVVVDVDEVEMEIAV
jgi:hypothetical protein